MRLYVKKHMDTIKGTVSQSTGRRLPKGLVLAPEMFVIPLYCNSGWNKHYAKFFLQIIRS